MSESALNRPTERDAEVIQRAAQNSLSELKQWLGDEAHSYEDSQLLADLSEAVAWEDDGYGRARVMERKGYAPDFRLVDIMKGVDVWSAERELVAEWVKANGMEAPYPIGTIVEIDGTTGEITANDPKLGQSTVLIESRGHVRTGVGTRGLRIAWEKLHPKGDL